MSVRTLRFVGMLAAAACACTSTERAAIPGSSSAPPAPPKSEGGVANSMPASKQLEIEPQTITVKTNAGSEPQFVFRIALKYGPSEPYHGLLSERATFVGPDGKPTPATVVGLEVKYGEPGLGYQIAIVPAAKLVPGKWYRLEIQEDTKLAVRSLAPSGAGSNPWSLAFFTSSAPHLTRSEWSAKNPTVLRLEFSEPLELATVAVGKLANQAGGQLATCILIGGVCASTPTSAAADVVDVQLSKPPDMTQPVAVVLGNSVMGAGQSVADGAKAAAYDSELTSEGIATTIASSDWKACQTGAAECWAWHGGAAK